MLWHPKQIKSLKIMILEYVCSSVLGNKRFGCHELAQ